MQHLDSQTPHLFSTKKKGAGFTLIEAMIYIALFTFVIGGGILSAYQIFEGSARIQALAEEETEINFIVRKLDWALSGSEIVSPLPSVAQPALTVNKGGTQYTFSRDASGVFQVSTTGWGTVPLTGSGISIDSMNFVHFDGGIGEPNSMSYTFVVDGETIGPIIRYVRTD